MIKINKFVGVASMIIIIVLFGVAFTKITQIEKLYIEQSNNGTISTNKFIELKEQILNMQQNISIYSEQSEKTAPKLDLIIKDIEKKDEQNSILEENIGQNKLLIRNIKTQLDYYFSPRIDERSELVTQIFYENEVELKPQAIHYHNDYDLTEVTPYIYEYKDDTVFIYYFEDKASLYKDIENLDNILNRNCTYHKFIVDQSILIIHITGNDTNYDNQSNENLTNLESAISKIRKALN